MSPRGTARDRVNLDQLVADFTGALSRLGPFESEPHLAIAVSGGADSMALALLADRWARDRGGRVTALTVDHGLRPEAAAEARQVGRWLRSAKIRHVILRWQPAVPRKTKISGSRLANLQAAARDARYDLLTAWCRDHAVLHLLLAHHQDDQAETLLLRLARGSGLDGLAAMAPLAERSAIRMLRPMLGLNKAALTGYLTARGQAWIEDPSNRDTANARIRLRQILPRLAEEGMTALRLAETAARLAQARAALDGAVNRLLAEGVAVYPEGYLRLDKAVLGSAEREVGMRALARAISCIGGQPYGPRLERLTRLYDLLSNDGSAPGLGRGRTLGGCRIVPARRADGDPSRHVLVMREPAAVAPSLSWNGLAPTLWDSRFRILPRADSPNATGSKLKPGVKTKTCRIGAVGELGLQAVIKTIGEQRSRALPRDVLVTLPALRQGHVVLAVPHLGFWRDSTIRQGRPDEIGPNGTWPNGTWQALFAPVLPLTRPGFTLV